MHAKDHAVSLIQRKKKRQRRRNRKAAVLISLHPYVCNVLPRRSKRIRTVRASERHQILSMHVTGKGLPLDHLVLLFCSLWADRVRTNSISLARRICSPAEPRALMESMGMKEWRAGDGQDSREVSWRRCMWRSVVVSTNAWYDGTHVNWHLMIWTTHYACTRILALAGSSHTDREHTWLQRSLCPPAGRPHLLLTYRNEIHMHEVNYGDRARARHVANVSSGRLAS